ncbi:hypothetical protein D3C85_1856940 [compost metagenome]
MGLREIEDFIGEVMQRAGDDELDVALLGFVALDHALDDLADAREGQQGLPTLKLDG